MVGLSIAVIMTSELYKLQNNSDEFSDDRRAMMRKCFISVCLTETVTQSVLLSKNKVYSSWENHVGLKRSKLVKQFEPWGEGGQVDRHVHSQADF